MPINTLSIESATQTGAHQSAGVDVSGLTGDWTLKLQVLSLTAAKHARIVFEESVDNFTTVFPVAEFNFLGPYQDPNGSQVSFKKRDAAGGSKFGVASGKVRLNLIQIDGSATIVYNAGVVY